MNLKIRRSLFYSLIAVFLILAFFIIPYSNGLRFDPNTLSFVKLGGLYLNVEPTEAAVQVDKLNFEIKSGFMKSGLLIANLFPKTYHVSIRKDGYQSWNKNLIIKPSLVTQIYPVILVPENNKEELLENKVIDLFPNANYLAWQDASNKLKINGKTVKGTEFLTWLAGGRSALVYDETSKNYLVINTAQNNSALNIGLLFNDLKYQKNIDDKSSITKIIGHPSDKNKLILATAKNLYVLDLYRPSLEIIQSGRYDLFSASGEEIFFADPDNLYYYSLSKKETALLSNKNGIDSVKISPNNQFIAFSGNSKLSLLDRSKTEIGLTELVNDPDYFEFSPDSKKIAAVYSNNKIKVFFLGDDHELFNKKLMGVSSFEIDPLDRELQIAWHNNSCYIFVRSGTSLKFLEINDDPPVNLQTISNGVDKYFYNKQESAVYLIKNESLYKIKE